MKLIQEKPTLATAAAIDRLVHHRIILELTLPIYRIELAKKSQNAEVKSEQESSPGD